MAKELTNEKLWLWLNKIIFLLTCFYFECGVLRRKMLSSVIYFEKIYFL